MISKKTYIPAKPRNRKLVNVSGGGGIGRSDISGVVENSHEHPNKVVIDQILQQHLDVLGVLSIVDGNLKIDANAYSTGELSAYGIGSGGSSGGGVDLLQAWTDYDSAKDNWAVKAGLLVPFYNDTKSRLTSLEGGAALSLNVTGSGNAIASLTKSGTALTAVKGNFAELDTNGKIISSQLPSYVDDVLEYVNLAAFPATGETGKIYIAQDSNKTYRWSGTAYVEISASLALGETSSTAYRGDRGKIAYDHSQLTGNPHGTTFAQIVSRPTTITGYGITDVYTKTEVNSALTLKLDKSVFDDLFEKVEVSAGVFAIKAKYNFYGVGEISAYGLGTGGSGGGSYERLDAWADYDSTKAGWVLSAFLGNELNSRVGNLEGGSALTVNTTGTGNAITSISKAGTVITANKGLTFSLSNHLHSASDITSGTFAIARIPTGTTGTTVAIGNHLHTGVYEPVFTKNTAFNKNFGTTAGTVAEGNHTHTFASLTNKPTTLAGYEITDAVTTNTTQTITGTKTFRNWKIDSPEGALGIQSYRVGTGMLWPYGNALSAIRTGLGFGWYDTEWIIGNIRGAGTDSYGFGIGYRNASGNLDGEFRIASGGAAYLNNVRIATISSNVASATKLQTPRTIWGQSFDGTGNVSGALSGATTGSFTGTITSPLYQSGAYNWVSKTGGFHSSTDGYQTGGLSVYDGTGTTANFYRLNNLLILGRAANQSLTIDTSSNVSILGNTTTNRIILSSTATEAQLEFSRPSYNYLTAPLNGGISFITNGDSLSALNSMLVLSPNGYVGVGKGFTNSTTAITAQLHVRGNILSTGEITAYVASDRRLKENIKPIISALDYINKLNPVSYNWNAKAKELNPMKPDSLDYGLIAQEVENVLPGVVHGIFDDKYKSIDYIKLIPIMIAAIKELKQKVNKL